jgi:ribonuclease HII
LGGADEAGRGAVLGPLVIAGVSLHTDRVSELKELGVKDSKLLTPKKRESLHGEICKLGERVTQVFIPPEEIDLYVTTGRRLRRLNYLEAIYFARVVDYMRAQKVYVDAADVNPGRFGSDISELSPFKCEVVSEHHADRNHPIVSAASIVAKVQRDEAVKLLREEFGEFGSGYPADPRTKKFLLEWLHDRGSMPDFSRKSWKSWGRWLQTTLP